MVLGKHREPAEKIRVTMSSFVAQMEMGLRDRLLALAAHCGHVLRLAGGQEVSFSQQNRPLACVSLDGSGDLGVGKGGRLSLEALD